MLILKKGVPRKQKWSMRVRKKQNTVKQKWLPIANYILGG